MNERERKDGRDGRFRMEKKESKLNNMNSYCTVVSNEHSQRTTASTAAFELMSSGVCWCCRSEFFRVIHKRAFGDERPDDARTETAFLARCRRSGERKHLCPLLDFGFSLWYILCSLCRLATLLLLCSNCCTQASIAHRVMNPGRCFNLVCGVTHDSWARHW